MFKRGSVAVVMAAGMVLATGGCGSGADEKADGSGKGSSDKKASADATPAEPPSEELVEWVGDMCESTTLLETARKDSTADLKQIRNPDETDPPVDHLAFRYIARMPWSVESVERDLKYLEPSGIPAADRLLDAWLKKLKRVVSALDEFSPGEATEDSAADADELVQSLTSPKPDLPALTEKHPRLAAAYERAEQCAPGWKPPEEKPAPDPSDPLPEAADGKNTDACSDGECEVLVTSEAKITANGLPVDISVANQSVTFQSQHGVIQLGGTGGGEARFGDELTITVVAQNEDGAVLEFTAP